MIISSQHKQGRKYKIPETKLRHLIHKLTVIGVLVVLFYTYARYIYAKAFWKFVKSPFTNKQFLSHAQTGTEFVWLFIEARENYKKQEPILNALLSVGLVFPGKYYQTFHWNEEIKLPSCPFQEMQ